MKFIDYLTDESCGMITVDTDNEIVTVYDGDVKLSIACHSFEDFCSRIGWLDCRPLAINECGKKRGKVYDATYMRFCRLRSRMESLVKDYIDYLVCIAQNDGIDVDD